jgi:pyrimidine-nucleoside phosphorylase
MTVRAVDVILAKRHGLEHDRATLEAFVLGYVRGEVPDYQVAAWLMAVVWRGMTPQETADLTEVMADSGERLDLSGFPHAVDKHSTGGVGDKTTLVLAPLLAELGASVPKMSGRGLGHTGGTIDKLESIPGFRATLDEAAFLRQVRSVGVAVTGQTKTLAPADGLLYALRDATGTVASLPLIASSIMSKKLAGGAGSLVLDVKVGSGAFMKTEAEARALAEAMVDIGRRAGRNVRAVLSSMAEPLGHAIGNALEVREAIEALRGGGPSDLRSLTIALATEALDACGLPHDPERVARALDDGSAYARFERWVAAQGGDVAALARLEVAPDEAPWSHRRRRGRRLRRGGDRARRPEAGRRPRRQGRRPRPRGGDHAARQGGRSCASGRAAGDAAPSCGPRPGGRHERARGRRPAGGRGRGAPAGPGDLGAPRCRCGRGGASRGGLPLTCGVATEYSCFCVHRGVEQSGSSSGS